MNQQTVALCKKISLEQVFKHFNIEYPNGVGHIKCPFPAHNATGQTPSFKFYDESNSFFCWGCHKGGDAINFVMGMRGVDFLTAAQYLVEVFKVKVESSFLVSMIRSLQGESSEVDKYYKIISQIVSIRRKKLKNEEILEIVMSFYKFISLGECSERWQ